MSERSRGNRDRVLYWIFTGLLTLQMLGTAGMQLFNPDMGREGFIRLGYPTYILYPLAMAKLLGLAAVLSNRSYLLKNLAYAGFLYLLLLAVTAHLAAGEGPETVPAALALVWLAGSFHFDRKVRRAP